MNGRCDPQKVDAEGFITVHKNKKSSRRPRIVGTNTHHRFKGAPEPSRDIYVYRVYIADTDREDLSGITDYLVKDKGLTPRSVQLISKAESKYASYKVELKMSDLKTALDADFWPEGVCVRRFFNRREQKVSNEETESSEHIELPMGAGHN